MAKKLNRSLHQTDDEKFTIEVDGKFATILGINKEKLKYNDLIDLLAAIEDAALTILSNP